MCQQTENIKLCTCVDKGVGVEELDNYWILYKYSPQKVMTHTAGSAVLPELSKEEIETGEHILERLNEGEAFDQEFDFGDEDKLYVSLTQGPDKWENEFVYSGGFWMPIGPNPFDDYSQYKLMAEGEVEFQPDISTKMICPSCYYKASSDCMNHFCTCYPAVCNSCKSIYDVNTEFCGDSKEVNKCNNCGSFDYTEWSKDECSCPKCGEQMKIEWN